MTSKNVTVSEKEFFCSFRCLAYKRIHQIRDHEWNVFNVFGPKCSLQRVQVHCLLFVSYSMPFDAMSGTS